VSRPAYVLEWSPGAAGPLLEAEEDLSWRDAAPCQYTDPELFFPERGGSTKAARRVCADCAVSDRCLDFALDNFERFGIWGGKSERERCLLLAARHPDVPRCKAGWHPLLGENLLPDGNCRACSDNSRKGGETRRIAKELAA
jgi:WhiB family transcriptional regulator, redox-sensing transcriptional regulator